EGPRNFGIGACRRGRIRDAPMRGDRLPRPKRARLMRGVVTDREDKIELGCVRMGEVVPALGTQLGHVVVHALEKRQGLRMNRAFGLATCRIGVKTALAE